MSSRLTKLIVALIFICQPFSTFASENSKNTTRWYKVYWNNLHIADLKVNFGEGEIESKIESYGAVKAISKYKNYAYSKFRMDRDKHIPESFSFDTSQRQGKKSVRIIYGSGGEITGEEVIPPDKRFKRAAVEGSLKKGAVNPLIAASMARDKIRAGLKDGTKEFSINIYDGRRLSKLDFNIVAKENIKILDKYMDVVKITFKRHAIAGFTSNELKRMHGEDPDFTVYLGAGDLLPVMADAVAPLGKARFVLEKECISIEACS